MKFDPTLVDSRGYSIYDPASAYWWIPKVERERLKEEREREENASKNAET